MGVYFYSSFKSEGIQMGANRLWCKNCSKFFKEQVNTCPECHNSDLIDVERLFTKIIDEISSYYSQIIESFQEIDKLARDIEEIVNRYIRLKDLGFKGKKEVSSKILNFYAKLSCFVEPTSVKVNSIKKEFTHFKGENPYFLPPSGAMEKISEFESTLLERIFSLKRNFQDHVASLRSPKKFLQEKIKEMREKEHLLSLFKINRSLNERESIVRILSSKKKKRILFITSQRMLVINTLKNHVGKEIPLSKITELELQGWGFTRKIVVHLTTREDISLNFQPDLLPEMRKAIKLGKQSEKDTFIEEQRLFKPSTPQLSNAIASLFEAISLWIRKEQEVIVKNTKRKIKTNGKKEKQGKNKNEKLRALKKTVKALEDAFKKGHIKDEYYFSKKKELEQEIEELKEERRS